MTKSLFPYSGKQALRLGVRLSAQCHFKLDNINQSFSFASRAEEWEID